MRKISCFFIAAALIAGMVGCGDGNGVNGGNGGDSYESYNLTIDSTAGGVVAVNSSKILTKTTFIYGAGTVVSLNAIPDSDYQFVKWTGDVGTIDNVHASEINITVNDNYYIMAKFEIPPTVQYRLAIFSTAGGLVTTPGEDGFTYNAGTVVNLMATPARGYEFTKWTGDVDTISNVNAASTTITMNGDYYICAHFREDYTCG